MKRILIFLLVALSVNSYGQSKVYIRTDTLIVKKEGGNSELQILNASRAVTNGLATNVGNGVLRYVAPSFVDSLKRSNDSIFAKINGSWVFYFRDEGSSPRYFNILLSGQSNAWGASGPTAHDTSAHPRVLIWNHAQATPGWITARIDQRPFRTSGYNSVDGGASRNDLNGSSNATFYLAKKLAEENPFDTIRIVMAVGDGRTIDFWFSGGIPQRYLDSLTTRGDASGISKVDLFVWCQGESDFATAEANYVAAFDSIKANLRRKSWFLPTTPIVVSGLPVMASSGNNYAKDSTLKKQDFDSDVWTGYAYTTGLTIANDDVHYSGGSLDTLGSDRYYQAWRNLPYRNSERGVFPNQWLQAGTKIFYNAGNVGINNSVPQVGLDLGSGRAIRVQSFQFPTSGVGMEMGYYTVGPIVGYVYAYDRDANVYKSTQFGGTTNGATTGQYLMYQKMPDGKLGIGNNDPAELLSVGRAGFVQGVISLGGSTSGKAILTTPAVAGTPTFTFPIVSGTVSQFAEGTTASSAAPAPSGDARENVYDVTALATDPTFAAPSGTPANHNTLLLRIKDNGTARALSWNAIYRDGTELALPTTTTISKTMYVYFIYNSADSKWDLVGLTDGL